MLLLFLFLISDRQRTAKRHSRQHGQRRKTSAAAALLVWLCYIGNGSYCRRGISLLYGSTRRLLGGISAVGNGCLRLYGLG